MLTDIRIVNNQVPNNITIAVTISQYTLTEIRIVSEATANNEFSDNIF